MLSSRWNGLSSKSSGALEGTGCTGLCTGRYRKVSSAGPRLQQRRQGSKTVSCAKSGAWSCGYERTTRLSVGIARAYR